MSYFLRMTAATSAALLAWTALTALFLVLPAPFAIAALFAGLMLFLVGADLHIPWAVAAGGVLMFAGVFAAALLGALK